MFRKCISFNLGLYRPPTALSSSIARFLIFSFPPCIYIYILYKDISHRGDAAADADADDNRFRATALIFGGRKYLAK